MRKTSLTVIACAMLLCAGTAQATNVAATGCEYVKLLAQEELEYCLAQYSALAVEGGPDESAVCQESFTAELALGGSCRYLNNGDGTVSDLNTGLMWEIETETAGPDYVFNTYTWSISGSAPDGTAFTSFLGMLNDGIAPDNGGSPSPITGCFANHCDWRLPSIVELQGIVDLSAPGCGSGTACIDPTFGLTLVDYYWSATTIAGFPDIAWAVDFGNGSVGGMTKGSIGFFYARAVRGGL